MNEIVFVPVLIVPVEQDKVHVVDDDNVGMTLPGIFCAAPPPLLATNAPPQPEKPEAAKDVLLETGRFTVAVQSVVEDNAATNIPDTCTTLPTLKYWHTVVAVIELNPATLVIVGVYVPPYTTPVPAE